MLFKRLVSIVILLELLIPMDANGQEKHTFEPLPENAKILSEKEGVREVQLENGVILLVPSEQEKARRAKQKSYTLEQRRNAKTLEVIINDEPDSTPPPRAISF